MGSTTIGHGEQYPHLAKVWGQGEGQKISSAYYTYVTKNILYTFT